MTAGYSGSFGINGVDLALQPTEHSWTPRASLGYDGGGHPVYSAVRDFEMRWVLADPSDYNQLQLAFQAISVTGTAVVDLPQYGASAYLFYSYSGCIINEPEMRAYFNEHHTDIRLTISGIRT